MEFFIVLVSLIGGFLTASRYGKNLFPFSVVYYGLKLEIQPSIDESFSPSNINPDVKILQTKICLAMGDRICRVHKER